MRQFVDADFADELSDTRDARIVLLRPLRTGRFGIDSHRAELDKVEILSKEPYAGLAEECGPSAVELYE